MMNNDEATLPATEPRDRLPLPVRVEWTIPGTTRAAGGLPCARIVRTQCALELLIGSLPPGTQCSFSEVA